MDRLKALEQDSSKDTPLKKVTFNASQEFSDTEGNEDPEVLLEKFYKMVETVQKAISNIQTKGADLKVKHADKMQTPDLN